MNFIICRRSVSVFTLLSAAVLVIVNGQPTSDDNIDNDEIASLREDLDKSAPRIAQLEGQFTGVSAELADLRRQFTELSAKKSDQSK